MCKIVFMFIMLLMKLDARPKFVHPSEPFHKEGRFAAIDIGSSTIRLVVYDTGAYPHLFLNHKVRTRLAQGKGEGIFYMDIERMERTLNAIEWFLWVCAESSVTTVVATATSAVREAENGSDFVEMVREKTGLHIEIISGETEARLSALGGTTSMPDASGVVMDLGGGSLDICHSLTGTHFASLPLGVLSLQQLSEGNPYKAVDILKTALTKVDWLSKNKLRDLVTLGSGMRSIASLHMVETAYPMRVLHDYCINKDEAIAYCEKFLKGDVSHKIANLTKGYEDVLPYRAAALKAILEVGDFEQVRFASFGIREGIFFSQIEEKSLTEDPLMSFAIDLAMRNGRGINYAFGLADWTHQIFPKIQPRLLQVAALFADVSWREQYAYRASSAFETVYGGSFVACSHSERAKLALISYFTHADELLEEYEKRVTGVLSKAEIREAKKIGTLFHLAAFLDPGANDTLSNYKLNFQEDGSVKLEGSEAFTLMQSDSVIKRVEIFNKILASKR